MFTDWRREWQVRRTLRALARQRVALILQPGNVWVVEKAVSDEDDTASAIRTCFMRGWVEPLADAVPTGKLGPGGELPPGLASGVSPMFRLTEAGWNEIHRSHQMRTLGVWIALVSLLLVFR